MQYVVIPTVLTLTIQHTPSPIALPHASSIITDPHAKKWLPIARPTNPDRARNILPLRVISTQQGDHRAFVTGAQHTSRHPSR
jgi:hypothetical protein